MAALARNAPMRRLVAAYLLNGIGQRSCRRRCSCSNVENVLQEGARAGILLFVYFLCGILAVPVWLRLSYRFGKHRVWAGAMVWACAVFVWVPLLGPGDFWWFVGGPAC